MKKNILPLLMAVVALCSCSDEDLGGFSGIKTGEVIDFGVSAVKTRANYTDGIDSKQVRWEAGDEVRIYYVYTKPDGNVEKTSADYTVTPVDGEIGEHKELGSLVAKDANNQLKWAEGSGHKFYAVYPAPADNKITIDEKGVATFPINRDQKCTIRDNKSTESAYTYVAEPDDKNIYMVASATAGPQSGSVWLDFKPIMTTINVVVKGPLNTTENQETPNVVVTGVSLISTITTNTDASKSEFKYDITNGVITGSGSASGTETATKQTESTFISVVNKDGLNAIEMKKDETLVLTGFLPPMAAETAKALERQVQIRVHTTGGNKTMPLTFDEVTALLPSAKGAIKLPSMYTPITGSNWITPLDDDIYVSQLSIPGTHDAATKDCGLSQGRCQDLTIEDQLKMGIRLFDLRPRANLDIYHGEISCKTTLYDVWDQFNAFLKQNPGEFIITLIRWENEGDVTLGFGLDAYEDFNANMMAFVASDRYTQYALEDGENHNLIKKDLTVGEMRPKGQGRILTLLRPNQDVHVKSGKTTVKKKYIVAGDIEGEYCDTYITGYAPDTYAPDGMLFYTNFPGSLNNAQGGFLKKKFVDYTSTGNGGNGLGQQSSKSVSVPNNWDIWCQNYYEVSTGDEETKIQAVKDYMDHATEQAKKLSHVWVLNHCSGYVGSALQSTAYAKLSNKLNPEIYNFIQNREAGALGFVFLDFVGSRYSSASSTLEVYGDLLPQTIIDNNYKYRMKRKGENSK